MEVPEGPGGALAFSPSVSRPPDPSAAAESPGPLPYGAGVSPPLLRWVGRGRLSKAGAWIKRAFFPLLPGSMGHSGPWMGNEDPSP